MYCHSSTFSVYLSLRATCYLFSCHKSAFTHVLGSRTGDKMVRTNGMNKMVYGQNGIGQNGMDKMVLDKMVWTKWYGQNGTDKINQSINRAPTDNMIFSLIPLRT